VEFLKLKRGGSSSFWAALYRARLARAPLPFWRVVVEAKLDRRVKRWPPRFDSAVTAVFVWARTIEEAEGLAALALEAEGLVAVTADAQKSPPAAAPRKKACAVARSELGFLERADNAGAKPSRSRA
jgi:hypothetical protein